eukprot:gb/GFBE01059944.1/.p1 GENE.gb/GFBE01059944.1/~~gb/GFBE01059944.1/.p1  ORF type:complete len:802 (+),score=236.80 gb/GFBE01059944.1/:1-2406(+)
MSRRAAGVRREAKATSSAAAASAALIGSSLLLSSSAREALNFVAPRPAPRPATRVAEAAAPSRPASRAAVFSTAASSALPKATAAAAAAIAAGSVFGSLRRRQLRRQLRRRLANRALPPESADFLHHAQQLWQHAVGAHDHAGVAGVEGVEDLANALQQWADAIAEGARHAAHDAWPPAYAEAPPALELDPNTKYLYGADGAVLVDPMNNKPIPDDWWNGFIGFQSDIIKDLDAKLREAGVPQAFGWTIVLYTVIVKVLFYPLQQGQLRSTTMMQMLSPKVKEIQEKYQNDPDTQQRLLAQLYGVMDVNPLGGCLPVLLQLPIFWSLYGVWRRLAAERYPFFTEGWLWVPSLAQPNPDFQFKYDWMLEFKDGAPVMGWNDYLSYLVFPAILVGFTVISQQQAQAAKPKTAPGQDDSQQLILQVLPWISVYFIGSLSLQLPQAVSVYYSVNTVLSVAQTQLVKLGLRSEIAGYEEFEKTGKFPEGAFEDMVRASAPVPKTLHEAALRGDVKSLEKMLDDTEKSFDINGWDEKNIAPIGYAVACGHLESVNLLLKRGADITIKDGQDNTLLHYAAGYGHMDVLKELIEASKDAWPNDEWKDMTNGKSQTVVDAARVNRKGQIVDFLCERLGLDAEVVKLPPKKEVVDVQPTPAAPAASAAGGADASQSDAARARAALLAAAGGEAANLPPAAASASSGAAPSAGDTASAMKAAVDKLKSNPEALKQAREMMGKMPPQVLQMMTGNKLSAEQAQKAMDAMSKMSTEEILEKATVAADKMGGPGAPAKETVTAAPPGAKPARSVD